MNPGQHIGFWPIALLMFVAGIGIPVMAAFNAGVGQSLQNPAAASATLFAVGLVAACLCLLFTGVPHAAHHVYLRGDRENPVVFTRFVLGHV